MFNIYQLLIDQYSGSHRVYPCRYRHAALQTVVIALVVTWTVTLSWYPDEAWKHPKYITIGAFNFCFGWYAAPLAHRAPTSARPMPTHSAADDVGQMIGWRSAGSVASNRW